MEVEIGKWGNSLALRIPMSLVKELSLHAGEKAELFAEEGKLILKPKQRAYTFDELMDMVTPENMHDFIETGPAVGKEIIDDIYS